MESSSHGVSDSDGTTPSDAPLPPQSTTLEPDLPTSSLEIIDSIELVSASEMSAEIAGPVTLSMMEMETSQTSESTAEPEPSALAAVPETKVAA